MSSYMSMKGSNKERVQYIFGGNLEANVYCLKSHMCILNLGFPFVLCCLNYKLFRVVRLSALICYIVSERM